SLGRSTFAFSPTIVLEPVVPCGTPQVATERAEARVGLGDTVASLLFLEEILEEGVRLLVRIRFAARPSEEAAIDGTPIDLVHAAKPLGVPTAGGPDHARPAGVREAAGVPRDVAVAVARHASLTPFLFVHAPRTAAALQAFVLFCRPSREPF